MPSLLLLLTILTAPTVPPGGVPWLSGSPVGPGAAEATHECRLRIGPGRVPIARVDVGGGVSAWFVIDTGATGTTLGDDLARRLGLRLSGNTRMATADGAMSVPTARLGTLGIAGVLAARDLDVAVHDLALVREVVPEADGILGQDVLARFDYLVDLDRATLTIGWFPPPARGVALPLTWSAGRPVLLMPGPGGMSGLVLDSGTDVLVLESGAASAAIGDARPAGRTRAVLRTHAGARAVDVEHHAGLPAEPVLRNFSV